MCTCDVCMYILMSRRTLRTLWILSSNIKLRHARRLSNDRLHMSMMCAKLYMNIQFVCQCALSHSVTMFTTNSMILIEDVLLSQCSLYIMCINKWIIIITINFHVQSYCEFVHVRCTTYLKYIQVFSKSAAFGGQKKHSNVIVSICFEQYNATHIYVCNLLTVQYHFVYSRRTKHTNCVFVYVFYHCS